MCMIQCTKTFLPAQVILWFLFKINSFRCLYQGLLQVKYLTIKWFPVYVEHKECEDWHLEITAYRLKARRFAAPVAQCDLIQRDLKIFVTNAYEPIVAHQARAYLVFYSMKQLDRYFYSPLDGIVVHRRVIPSTIKLVSTHLYTWVERSTVRVASFPRTQHNVPAAGQAHTWTAHSRSELSHHHYASPGNVQKLKFQGDFWIRKTDLHLLWLNVIFSVNLLKLGPSRWKPIRWQNWKNRFHYLQIQPTSSTKQWNLNLFIVMLNTQLRCLLVNCQA